MFTNDEHLFNQRDRDINNVYKNHFEWTCLLTYKILGDWEDSRDVATTAFEKLYASNKKLEKEADIKNYLCRIIRNECLNRIKKMKVHGKYVDYVKKSEVWYESGFLRAREEAEFVIELKKALQGLSQMEGDVVDNIFVQKKSQAETAEKLKISVRTVKRLKRSAIQKLRDLLKYKLIIVTFLSVGVAEAEGISRKIGKILAFFHDLVVFISDQWNIG